MFNDLIDTIGYVEKCDPDVGAAMKKELARQRRNLELIASENIVSPAVMAAMGSVLTNKYAEGYPGKRYYGGCEAVDIVEEIAIERAKKLFGAQFANVQAHSGAQANTAVYFALLQPGDTVLGMSLAHGGHLTHGSPVNLSGKYFNFLSYGVGDDGVLDYDAVEPPVPEVVHCGCKRADAGKYYSRRSRYDFRITCDDRLVIKIFKGFRDGAEIAHAVIDYCNQRIRFPFRLCVSSTRGTSLQSCR